MPTQESLTCWRYALLNVRSLQQTAIRDELEGALRHGV